MQDEEKIVLGSGTLFCVEFTGEIPADATFETDDNELAKITGGASLEYKPSYYTVKDDMGTVEKTVLTDEESTLKSGLLTWNGKTLSKLCSTARVTEEGSTRTVKIGGVKNQDGKRYAIRFVHKDAVDGDIRVTIVGRNQNGFTFAFAKDKETAVDAEFKAEAIDNDGTLIIFQETGPETGSGEE